MRRGYRIFQKQFATAAFTGEGARLYGGRWNSIGVPMVYVASSFALAILEMLANGNGRSLPRDVVYTPVDIPDEIAIETLETSNLPKGWFRAPASPELAEIGDRWVQESRTAVLIVPSAIARIESNLLLNPAHPDYARILVGQTASLDIDERLLKRTSQKRSKA